MPPTIEQTDATTLTVLEEADLLRPMAIRAMATLGIADMLVTVPRAASEIATALGADTAETQVLLRYLALLGFLEGDEGGYSLSPKGAVLCSDHPVPVGAALSARTLLGRSELALVNLPVVLDAEQDQVVGGFWQAVQHDDRYRDELGEMLGSGTAWDAEVVVSDFPWGDVSSVLDVGGANGALLTSLLTRHQHLRGGVLDLPNAIVLASRALASAGLDERGTTHAGDFFSEVPPGYDVYLLSAVLADWSDDDAVRILRSVGTAAGSDGRILVSEVSLPRLSDTDPSAPNVASDLYVMCSVARRGRSAQDIAVLARRAGLELVVDHGGTAVRGLVELRKA